MPLLFVAIAAQEPAPPAQLEPFRTEVNYIRVDMYPTADGKPVTDLRQDEIEILDEGAPQKIDRFEHVLVRGTRSQEMRREPSTMAEMREAMQDVRVRARTGYLAATRGDEAKAKAAATAVAAAKPVDARAEAVKGSLSTLGHILEGAAAPHARRERLSAVRRRHNLGSCGSARRDGTARLD